MGLLACLLSRLMLAVVLDIPGWLDLMIDLMIAALVRLMAF